MASCSDNINSPSPNEEEEEESGQKSSRLSPVESRSKKRRTLPRTSVSCQELTPVNNEENSLEGSTVTLSYNYSKQADNFDHFFWYRQYPGKPPEFLMYISGLNKTRPADSLKSETRFFTGLFEDKRGVKLQISSAAVSDSAVYYCAQTQLTKPLNTYSNSTTSLTAHFTCVTMETLAVILLFSALVGNTLEDDITASSAEVFSSEGRSVTLSCNYSVKANNLQWYRKDPGSAPQFLLLITDTTSPTVVNAKPADPRLTVELKTKRVDLQISSAAVSDSAVYYCALQPTSVKDKTV
ncbi:uncharacterized protein [Thunnus thynnus]|uniref:uncharacterized protein n=1 Tax=Thunnus thynnus TaxID=8237 RepID=UPI00352959A0